MNLCVSNIAWDRHDDPDILELLRREDVGGIEVAPTKVWPDWHGATPTAAALYRKRLADEGFRVPSMQAIFFGRPELALFGDTAQRQAFVDHVRYVADLAAALGARVLVYGAPKSRDRGTLSVVEAMNSAAEVLALAGEACVERGTYLCIEPNPAAYGCNFVTRSDEARRLIELVGSPGFRLHLDAAGMALADEEPERAIASAATVLQHFHASEPNLGPFDAPVLAHERYAGALVDAGYEGWISIEMRATDTELLSVGAAVRYVKAAYTKLWHATSDVAQRKHLDWERR